VFTTGMAGSGKSTLMYGLLNESQKKLRQETWDSCSDLHDHIMVCGGRLNMTSQQ